MKKIKVNGEVVEGKEVDSFSEEHGFMEDEEPYDVGKDYE